MNWDYVAGFFDGEGNLHVNQVRGGSGKTAYQLLIRIYSSNKKIVEELRDFIGFGKIYLKRKTEVYEFTISNKEEARRFLENLKGKTILKKDQITFLLENYSFERGNNLYFDVDKFRSFIKRKNVLRKQHTLKARVP